MTQKHYTPLELERMHQMLLSPHFALGEFLRSGTAIKYGIDNTPQDSIIITRLMMLCEQVLEPLRLQCGIITITSGYRCPQLNLAVHGVPGSQHTLGEAADIFIPNEETLHKYVAFIREHCHYDQLILEPRAHDPDGANPQGNANSPKGNANSPKGNANSPKGNSNSNHGNAPSAPHQHHYRWLHVSYTMRYANRHQILT